MQNTNYGARPPFWSNLGNLLEGSAASIVTFVLVPILIVAALLLPPVNLLDRIQTLRYVQVDAQGATVTDPDGTAAIFPVQAVDQPVRVGLSSVPRVDFLNGSAGAELRTAAENLPSTLIPKSPFYQLDILGETPRELILSVPIPNDSQPYETLDLYTWTGDSWEFLPNVVLAPEDRIESRLFNAKPGNFMVMQTTITPPQVTADIGLAAQAPPNVDGAVTQVAVAGLYLRGDGALDGALQPIPAGNYEIVPVLRNWQKDVVRTDLINNMLIDPGLQDNQLNAILDLVVANLYPGVIIDYRGVDAEPAARADFVRFVQRLAERLHAPEVNKTLAVRVEPPRQISAEEWDTGGYDWRALGQVVDLLIVPAPVDPRAYQPSGEMEALLTWTTDNVERSKVQFELPGFSVERSGAYLLQKGYQEALQPLLGQIQAEEGVAVPGEPVELTLDNPRLLSRVTFDESIGMYFYTYMDDQGFERTVYIENANSFAHKLAMLQRFNVSRASVRTLESGDVDPRIWEVARQFQQGALLSQSGPDLAVSYTVYNPDGSILTQETRPLDEPVYAFVAPSGEGNIHVEAKIVQNNAPVSQPQTVALALATPTPEIPPTPTPTPTPEFAGLTSGQIVNIREGPSTAYPLVGQLEPGRFYRITGKNEGNDWWQIELADGGKGWVFGQLVQPSGDLGGVAVITDIPKPPAPAPAAAGPAAVTGAPPPAGGGSFGYGFQIQPWGGADIGFAINATKGAGFNWLKIQVPWKDIESGGKGQLGWGGLDSIVNQIDGAGLNLLLSIVKAPNWARPANTDLSVEGPPANNQDFADFLGAVAARYKGRVEAIEVWNEQNLWYEWGGEPLDPARYVDMLCKAYAAIKAADPNMFVISGALTPTGVNDGKIAIDDFIYLQRMYDAGAKNCMDGVGAHPSGYNNPPDVRFGYNDPAEPSFKNHPSFFFQDTMMRYRDVMIKYGDVNKRIWPTEFGWASDPNPVPGYEYARDVTLEEQARYLVTAYQLMKQWGFVGPAFAWNLNFGITNPGTELAQFAIWGRPAYDALKSMPK